MRSTFEQDTDEYLFSSEIKVDTLSTFIEHSRVLVNDVTLRITEEGYHIRASNASNVGLIDTTLHTEAFERHRAGVDGTGSIAIGVDLEKVADVVDLVDKDQIVTLSYNEERRTLHIQGGGIKRSVGLIDLNMIRSDHDMPNVDLSTVISIPPNEFERGIKMADLVSDHVELGYYDGDSENRQRGIYIYSEGDNDDSLYEPEVQEVHEIGEGKTLLPLDPLKDIKKVTRKLDGGWDEPTLMFEFDVDMPIKMHLSIDEEVEGEMVPAIDTMYVVAPRIQTEWGGRQ